MKTVHRVVLLATIFLLTSCGGGGGGDSTPTGGTTDGPDTDMSNTDGGDNNETGNDDAGDGGQGTGQSGGNSDNQDSGDSGPDGGSSIEIGAFEEPRRLCDECGSFESFNGLFLIRELEDNRVSTATFNNDFLVYTPESELLDLIVSQSWWGTSREEIYGASGDNLVIGSGGAASRAIFNSTTMRFVRPNDVYAGEVDGLLDANSQTMLAVDVNSSGDALFGVEDTVFSPGSGGPRVRAGVMYDVFGNPSTIELPGTFGGGGGSAQSKFSEVIQPHCLFEDGNSGVATLRPGYASGAFPANAAGLVYFDGIRSGEFSWRYIIDENYGSIDEACIDTADNTKIIYTDGTLSDDEGNFLSGTPGRFFTTDGQELSLATDRKVEDLNAFGVLSSSGFGESCTISDFSGNELVSFNPDWECENMVLEIGNDNGGRLCLTMKSVIFVDNFPFHHVDVSCADVNVVSQ